MAHMHRPRTIRITIIALIVVPVFVLAGLTPVAAVAPVGLGTADNFAVLAGSTITNTGPTTITGDVGLHPAGGGSPTGFASVTLNGTLHDADTVALNAKTDLVTAYNTAAGSLPVTTVATELGAQTLPAGVYDSASGTFEITGTLTLDAQGDPNAVFIFQMETSLTTATSSVVRVINAGQACNVFWQVGSSATLGTSTTFIGNILALTSITLVTSTTVEGRLLARNGAVTMDTNTITRAICAQVTPPTTTTTLPVGPVATGGGSTGGVEDLGLLLVGGALLVGAVGVLGLRRRVERKGASS